ncbi:hypothetical protein ARC20_08375 [Stenotrophomonas panacihumi]|uniref:Outer membrane protein beta-barrel domain-containing protein n=1 Tax=Stenotrophomonas panacihumi TaxID=676599 RepID=A0A0R0AR39_9GAMM|nr:outer membrane beta-barrel protein [Stenotrophomonas panacihumi]KRG44426.1 hypothetical protein ARC20_08375 [Stenotrophomonas panacihumi]PTN54569.1 hypothetical protein C9J98_10055 [Stenotrophomonas panacihumi]
MPSGFIRCLPLLLGAVALHAHAQAVSPAWTSYREGTQAASPNAAPAPAQPATPITAPPPAYQPLHRQDRDLDGFFVGAQAGQGWVYEDVDQDAFAVSAGYRWQAGPYVLVGVELTSGVLNDAEDTWYRYAKVNYGGVGANARFNFGRSPWFAAARLGYFSADPDGEDDDGSFDGVYAGLGIGVDAGRHFSFSLMYTGFFYSSTYYYRSYNYSEYGTEVNRADLVTVGVEARF